MSKIQEWVYNLLVQMGLISENSSYLDNIVILLLIIAVTVGIDYSCRYIFLGMFKRLARKTKNQLDDLIVDRKIINKMMHMIPAILIYILLPFAFSAEETPKILIVLQKLCQIYIIAVSLRFINASLNLIHEIYNKKDSFKNKPLKGFIQILQVTVFFIGVILIISILINKSPVSLLAGLGASAAILMLVFKDTILGFVAGIQLSANDMLRAGDWITMSKYGADGTVIEVTLNAVKVRNFDNTITTIPPYALVSDSFQNWRGMRECGGRRIKRSLFIDMTTVHFCTPEEVNQFVQKGWITAPTEGNEPPVNLHVFREYALKYISNHPEVNHNLMQMVRQLQPTTEGIPVEIYCFSNTPDWIPYETLQGEIFDHLIAMIPEFGLHIFQRPAGTDFQPNEKNEFITSK